MQLNPYLVFNGQCEEAFKFYEQCMGGKIEGMATHARPQVKDQTPPEWRDKILHATLRVGEDVLTGSDAPPERIFHALAENGRLEMAIQETFWAARFGLVVDRFGIPWMINCLKVDV
jgi:PhnB protein